jgi:hypothetical protein
LVLLVDRQTVIILGAVAGADRVAAASAVYPERQALKSIMITNKAKCQRP